MYLVPENEIVTNNCCAVYLSLMRRLMVEGGLKGEEYVLKNILSKVCSSEVLL